MGAPCAETGILGYDPVALLDGRGPRPGSEDFEAGFVARDGTGFRRAESGGEGGFGGIGALDLVDICGVEGSG